MECYNDDGARASGSSEYSGGEILLQSNEAIDQSLQQDGTVSVNINIEDHGTEGGGEGEYGDVDEGESVEGMRRSANKAEVEIQDESENEEIVDIDDEGVSMQQNEEIINLQNDHSQGMMASQSYQGQGQPQGQHMAASGPNPSRTTIRNLIGKVFLSEKEMLETVQMIFPKGVKVCRKDKWNNGPHQGQHKKWRFVCECSGVPKVGGIAATTSTTPSTLRKSKKIGCPFFINAFWSRDCSGPRITTANFYHYGHDGSDVPVYHFSEEVPQAQSQQQTSPSCSAAAAASAQAAAITAAQQQSQQSQGDELLEQFNAMEQAKAANEPDRQQMQREMLLLSLKSKLTAHLTYLVSNFPLEGIVRKVHDFLSPETNPPGMFSQPIPMPGTGPTGNAQANREKQARLSAWNKPRQPRTSAQEEQQSMSHPNHQQHQHQVHSLPSHTLHSGATHPYPTAYYTHNQPITHPHQIQPVTQLRSQMIHSSHLQAPHQHHITQQQHQLLLLQQQQEIQHRQQQMHSHHHVSPFQMAHPSTLPGSISHPHMMLSHNPEIADPHSLSHLPPHSNHHIPQLYSGPHMNLPQPGPGQGPPQIHHSAIPPQQQYQQFQQLQHQQHLQLQQHQQHQQYLQHRAQTLSRDISHEEVNRNRNHHQLEHEHDSHDHNHQDLERTNQSYDSLGLSALGGGEGESEAGGDSGEQTSLMALAHPDTDNPAAQLGTKRKHSETEQEQDESVDSLEGLGRSHHGLEEGVTEA